MAIKKTCSERIGASSAAGLRRQAEPLPLEIRQDFKGNRPILTTNSHDIQHTAEFRTGLKENKS